MVHETLSGWPDSNRRPHVPQTRALDLLRHTPVNVAGLEPATHDLVLVVALSLSYTLKTIVPRLASALPSLDGPPPKSTHPVSR